MKYELHCNVACLGGCAGLERLEKLGVAREKLRLGQFFLGDASSSSTVKLAKYYLVLKSMSGLFNNYLIF